MSRTQRLLDLLQTLRSHRQPVSGQTLADAHDISIRTLYRDIATLQAQGADIEGEPGIGYILKPGYLLPPLMFSQEEIEALVLGSRWVASRADDELSRAARNALVKISAVLPTALKADVESSTLLVGPAAPREPDGSDLPTLRRAIRTEHALVITYRDPGGEQTHRTVWPFALGYFDRVRVVVAWCELRQAFRHFRTDRLTILDVDGKRYPRRRAALLKEWRLENNILPPTT